MPLSDKVRGHIESLSSSNKHNEIVTYLKEQLEQKLVTPDDIYDYAKRYTFTRPPKPHVINPSTINKLGVVVSMLKDKSLSERAAQFYQLAGERNDHWGCRNYAMCLLTGSWGAKKSITEALTYAEKAVQLAPQLEKHRHKFTLCEALRENQKRPEANTALMECLSFNDQQSRIVNKKSESEKEILNILNLYETITQEF